MVLSAALGSSAAFVLQSLGQEHIVAPFLESSHTVHLQDGAVLSGVCTPHTWQCTLHCALVRVHWECTCGCTFHS